MGQRVMLDDKYSAERPHGEAPWLIRNPEGRVVGHYSVKQGVRWGDVMEPGDRDAVGELLEKKLG